VSRRWTYAEALKELRGAQSSFGRARTRYARHGDDWQESLAAQVRMALARAERCIAALAVDARKGRLLPPAQATSRKRRAA